MSGDKKKVRHSQNCFKQWGIELYLDKVIGQLTKVRTPRKLEKAEQMNYENPPQKI